MCPERTITVPAIIEPSVFEQVPAQSAEPPRRGPPILLTGLAVCATCGDAMTLRTGTSSTGAIHHRYYTCCTCARKGKSACKGRSIRMDRLDGLVTDHLIERLLNPDGLRSSCPP